MIGILAETVRQGENIAKTLGFGQAFHPTDVRIFTPSQWKQHRGARWSVLIISARDVRPGTLADALKGNAQILWLDHVVRELLTEASNDERRHRKPSAEQPYDEPLPLGES